MRATISTRIGGAIFGLVIVLLLCFGAGYYAASTIDEGLKYITTVARDASVGAMEGTIALQAQVIHIHEFTQETDPAKMAALKEHLAKEIALENTSLDRMLASDFFDEKSVAGLNQVRAKFARLRDELIAAVEKVRVVSNGETITKLNPEGQVRVHGEI